MPTVRLALGLTVLAGLATTAGVLVPEQAAGATTTAVTNCADSGAGSLRQAVSSASPDDTITFALSPPCSTITVASTITIASSVTIDGPGAAALAVSGNNAVQVIDVPSSVTATISGLTIEKGSSSTSNGGGISNSGTLHLIDSTVSDNGITNTTSAGGGIFSDGTMTINDSTVSGNSALNGGAGGIRNDGMTTITDSTLSGNTSLNNGGAIHNAGDGTLIISDSTVTGNGAASNQYGGGVSNDNGIVTISNSTVSGNSAGAGGGVFNYLGTTSVSNSTLSSNTGGGLYNPQGTLNATATIVASSISETDCLGSITSLGYNLDDDGSCGFSGTSLSDTPAGLDPAGLQHNGGPAETVSLLGTSAAIHHVKDASLCPATDQRGFARTVPCDIGAYDTHGFGVVTSTLPAGAPRMRYSATLMAIGGNPPYRWSVSSGRLPKGLHLKKSTGVISGTPKKTDDGTYTFTVKVADKKIKVKHHPATQNIATAVLSITIS